MEEGRPSATAMMAAIQRAEHLLWDDDPKIFQDPLALDLSGIASASALQARFEAFQAERSHQTMPEVSEWSYKCARAGIVVRQRYAEDALDEAVERGVRQYVILGAGLDSFAYRRPDLAALVRVFEVDHPATQQWKRARLRDIHVTLPSPVTFIALDFEQHNLADGLHAGGHQPDLPTFFSWLGVTHYLTEEAVFTTLRYVASLAAGSEIVFSYFMPEELCNDEDRLMLTLWKARRSALGGIGIKPIRAIRLGSAPARARLHAGLGYRTRGSGRTLLCGTHGWSPCIPAYAPHESAHLKYPFVIWENTEQSHRTPASVSFSMTVTRAEEQYV